MQRYYDPLYRRNIAVDFVAPDADLGRYKVLLVPNLLWEAAHGWTSVHWFVSPPASATDESRPQYVVEQRKP